MIHPTTNVHTLKHALDARYDAFYESEVQKVGYEKCELGYILESEGPQKASVFDADVEYQRK